MSSIQNHLVGTSSLFRAVDAAKNWRAMGLLIATSICTVIVGSVFSYIAAKFLMDGNDVLSKTIGGIGALLSVIVFFCGFSAVGVVLMDQVKSNSQRTLSNALFVGLATLPRFLGLILLEMATAIVFAIVLAIVLFICKIPVIGPLLYTFVYPIMAIIVGVTFFSLVFVVNPLAAPSIWDGNNILQAIAKLWQLGKSVLLPVVLNQLVLGLIVFVVTAILFMMTGVGVSIVSSLSATILNIGAPGSMLGMLQGLVGMIIGGAGSDGGGYITGYMVGSAVLFAIISSIPVLMIISGNCLIYLQYVHDIDTSAIEEKIRSTVGDIKDRANAAREQLKQAQSPISNSLTCPNCHNAIFADDVFCGGCGHKLK